MYLCLIFLFTIILVFASYTVTWNKIWHIKISPFKFHRFQSDTCHQEGGASEETRVRGVQRQGSHEELRRVSQPRRARHSWSVSQANVIMSYVGMCCLACAERHPTEFTGPHSVRFDPWPWICSRRPCTLRWSSFWREWTTTPRRRAVLRKRRGLLRMNMNEYISIVSCHSVSSVCLS